MVNPLYVLVPCVVFLVSAYHGPDIDILGPFCGTDGRCCSSRQDNCSHPILDTLCYCDDFCGHNGIGGGVDDCCPDYEFVCQGLQTSPRPPPSTAAPEPQIRLKCEPDTKKMDGCNECTCQYTSRGYDWVCEQEECMMNEEVISMVNPQYGQPWVATNYSYFADKKLKDGLLYKLGTFHLSRDTERMGAIRYSKEIDYPTHFDARTAWPGYVTPITDQGWCGSDWAVVIAAVASDRFAIQSNGAENMKLSAQTLVSCNQYNKGCEGGHIDAAWNFVTMHGLVDEKCFPYEAKKVRCPYSRRGDLIKDRCPPLLAKRTSRYKVGPPGRLKHEKDIMYDLMESGPLHAVMTVYQDFFHYRSGVYTHTRYGNERLEGLHSVRLVGWGEQRGEKYWIVANSWGREWGEDGYFRIRRGVNESGIESFLVTVLPEVTEA